MTNSPKNQERVDFILGEEIPLYQIVRSANLTPLLSSIISYGALAVVITDEKGDIILSEGYDKNIKHIPTSILNSLISMTFKGRDWRAEEIYYEGELVGFLILYYKEEEAKLYETISKILLNSLKLIIWNTSKRLLTTELHTTTVKRSYEDLVEMYSNLAKSEKRYKELSATLEQKIEERTKELKNAYLMMIQKEKMASIGVLASGIAHEINNPISYIISNLNALHKYIKSFYELMMVLNTLFGEENVAKEAYTRLKIDLKLKDSVELIKQCLDGAERIKKIVTNLKGFSHIDEAEIRDVDINEEIDRTISILSHEIKTRNATIEKRYGKIPMIYINPNAICQVFFNIILNALQSKSSNVQIVITSFVKDNDIVISVKDNGCGISDEIKTRIFEPFFTTKDVGSVTGLGLSVVYDIVTSMGGSIEFISEVGIGSEFFVSIPIRK